MSVRFKIVISQHVLGNMTKEPSCLCSEKESSGKAQNNWVCEKKFLKGITQREA